MSTKAEEVILKINRILKAESDELESDLSDFELADYLVERIDAYEKELAKVFKEQRDYFLDLMDEQLAKADDDEADISLLEYFLKKVLPQALVDDIMSGKIRVLSIEFLTSILDTITATVMQAIDKEVAFKQVSGFALAWVDDWSEQLGDLLQVSSHNSVSSILKKTLAEGKGMQHAISALKKLPDFDRTRARRVAITEILTANSQAQAEAFRQSPSVAGKRWRHSGTRKINARKAHIALDGVEVGKDEPFDVNGHEGMFPRDTSLPPSERVECHCTMQPVIDSNILSLSADEKEKIRQKTMEEFDYDSYKRPPSDD